MGERSIKNSEKTADVLYGLPFMHQIHNVYIDLSKHDFLKTFATKWQLKTINSILHKFFYNDARKTVIPALLLPTYLVLTE